MKPILENWLSNQVGIIVDGDELEQALKDGMLFIRILKYYDVINVGSIRNVFPSEDLNVCRNNLTQLKIWFKLIDIDLTDNVINEILIGNTSVCIDILQQMFLVFNKGDLHLLTKQKERSNIRRCADRFKVSQTPLPGSKREIEAVGTFQHNERLLKKKNIIDWYKEKHQMVRNVLPSCQTAMRPLGSLGSLSQNASINKGCMDPPRNESVATRFCQLNKNRSIADKNYVKYELNKLNNSTSEESSVDFIQRFYKGSSSVERERETICNSQFTMHSFLPPIASKSDSEPMLPPNVDQYLKGLKSSVGFSCKRRVETSYSSLVIKDVWKGIVETEKNDLKTLICRRLMKQSAFEKDLASKFQNILAQHEIHKQCFIDFEDRIMKTMRSGLSLNLLATNTSTDNNMADRKAEKDEDGRYSYFNSTRQRFINNNYASYCLNEKKRTVELHRKLYAENVKLRFERHYAICLNTIEDIMDLAIKISEFENEYGFQVPYYIWNDWKCLFIHQQPIFDIISDVTEILFPDDTDALHLKEQMRQDILNDNYLSMYMDVKGLWEFITNDGSELHSQDKYTIDHESQTLLGYVVHRILELKYPLPPRDAAADIPKYPIVAVVHNIEGVEAITNFRNLLMKAEILVVDVNTALNFCLQCYKTHIGSEEFSVSQEIEGDLRSTSFDTVKRESEIGFRTDFTQTTSSLFEISDGVDLENASRLGHKAFQLMLLGSELPCPVLVDIMIEYIKQWKHKIKGWVLVNFPSTLYQASIIEFALSSNKFPFQLEDDIISSSDSECRISLISKDFPETLQASYEMEVKNSKIVPNPRIYNKNDLFKSYFSIYVTTVKGTRVDQNNEPITYVASSESTLLLEQPEKEGVPSLHAFYQEQGIGYDFIYESFDLSTLKQLSLVILLYFCEDLKLQKFPHDMFSEELLGEFGPSITINWNSSVALSTESSTLRLVKEHSSSGVITFEEQELSSTHDSRSGVNTIDEPNRNYANYPILDNAAFSLANVWEAIETIYLNGLKDVFFLKRNTGYSVIPYISSITKQMHLYLNRRDDRQRLVSEFLYAYNSIHQTLRSDNEMKNELHLRVIELKEQLVTLCKDKHDDVQRLLVAIINQNWTYQDMVQYTNFFIDILQIEINQCLRTLNFLQDYYLAMLGNYNGQPLPNVEISKLNLCDVVREEDEELAEEGEEMSEELEREKKPIDMSLKLENADELYFSVIDRLLSYENLSEFSSLFFDAVVNKATDGYQELLKVRSKIDGVVADEETVALKGLQDQTKTKPQPKKPEGKGKSGKSSAESPPQEVEAKDAVDEKGTSIKELFDEWRCTVKSEIERVAFRIELIKNVCKQKLNEIEALMGNYFSDINIQQKERFSGELTCIDNICRLFQIAIEEKTPINAQLIFEKDEFYTILDPPEEELPDIRLPAALEEMMFEESFTIKQLEAIKNRLKHIAPNGVITQEAFITFIESIIAYSSSRENVRLVPKIWSGLERPELEILFNELFGNCNLVEWRDFLICCLNLPLPLTEDIIDARLQFLQLDLEETEFIGYEDYMSTTLWFQRELPESPLHALRNVLAKEFIFALFKTSDKVNYMALLLPFCRDVDPKVGFGKALSLFHGKCVIVYEEDLYLEHILTDHVNTEIKVATQIIDEILDDVVSNSMSGERDGVDDEPETDVTSTHERFDSSETSGSDMDALLTESMYHEFFRRHLIFQWTSKVPNVIIMSLLCVTFYTVYVPDHIFLYSNAFTGVQEHLVKNSDGNIYIPDFVNTWWINIIFERVRKYNACSITSLIKEIISMKQSLPHTT